MDILEVLALGMTGFRGDSAKVCFLEFCGRHESVGSLATLPVAIIDLLGVSLMEMTPHGPGIFKTK
jgi:hypothetical protein